MNEREHMTYLPPCLNAVQVTCECTSQNPDLWQAEFTWYVHSWAPYVYGSLCTIIWIPLHVWYCMLLHTIHCTTSGCHPTWQTWDQVMNILPENTQSFYLGESATKLAWYHGDQYSDNSCIKIVDLPATFYESISVMGINPIYFVFLERQIIWQDNLMWATCDGSWTGFWNSRHATLFCSILVNWASPKNVFG